MRTGPPGPGQSPSPSFLWVVLEMWACSHFSSCLSFCSHKVAAPSRCHICFPSRKKSTVDTASRTQKLSRTINLHLTGQNCVRWWPSCNCCHPNKTEVPPKRLAEKNDYGEVLSSIYHNCSLPASTALSSANTRTISTFRMFLLCGLTYPSIQIHFMYLIIIIWSSIFLLFFIYLVQHELTKVH